MAITQQARIIFGLKIRQFRQEKGWNFEELSQHCGISVSYLNEIEKGKKYPQPANQEKLAQVLGVTTEFLNSPILTKQYAPLGDLLQSNFLNELPLDLFGIDLQQIVEIIARAPDRVNAFISAILEIARNYALLDENFFFSALRAYQELHMNYFDDIEQEVDQFLQVHAFKIGEKVPTEHIQRILETDFGYTVNHKGLAKYPELSSFRSVFNPSDKILLLNPKLSEQQQAFQLAKELGFNVLQLTERPYASNLLKIKSFEETLNNYKAAYFAVSLLVHRQSFVEELRVLFNQKHWDAAGFLGLLDTYSVSPEILFQRFNILSKEFDLQKMFFQRFIHNLETNAFDIDKELHLNRRHQPHASGLKEHYCRRWLAISLLNDLQQKQQTGDDPKAIVGALRARFVDSGEEYLCIAMAKPGFPTPNRNVSVSVGLLIDEQTRSIIQFVDADDIPRIDVGVTCERCTIQGCTERVSPPRVIERREARKRTLDVLNKVIGIKN